MVTRNRLLSYRFPAQRPWEFIVSGQEAVTSKRRGWCREVRTSSEVHLPCTPASVGFARRVLSEDLRSAGVFDGAVGDATLVISELVSNAILHAYPLPGEQLKIAWAMTDGWLEVAVSDGGSATLPHDAHPTPGSVSGRGLAIVSHICRAWGVRTDDVGLTVWAILAAPSHDGAAPRRSPSQAAAPAQA
ncbi:MAG TPA: ATP-binding protein [Streptosporangiaceae bacterium]|nr:ATP-binding protein [Streptosporangiaceae bacterium]